MLVSGCASGLPSPQNIDENLRNELTRSRVVLASEPPGTFFYAPVIGVEKSAAQGAAFGGTTAVLYGTRNSDPIVLVFAPFLFVGGAIIGGIAGGTQALPEDTAKQIEDAIKESLIASQPQQTLKSKFQRETALIGLTGLKFVEAKFDSRSQFHGAGSHASTVIEIGISRVGLIGNRGSNPLLMLAAQAHYRILDSRTGNEIIEKRRITELGSRRKFADWGESNAILLRSELSEIYQRIGKRLAEEIFLETR